MTRSIPSFSLYGEQAAAARTDSVHIEDIQSRSRKYLWKIGTHRHTRLSQCVFLSAGSVAAQLDDVQTDLAGPAVIIIPAGIVHSFRFTPETRGFVLSFDLHGLLGAATTAHQPPIETLFFASRAFHFKQQRALAARLEHLFERLSEEFRERVRGRGHERGHERESVLAPVVGWLSCCVLWMIAVSSDAVPAPHPLTSPDLERLRRFKLLIEDNFLKHWPVKRYAKKLMISEASLNRVCRRCAGTSAFYLIQQRLALEARRRLVYVAHSVSRIGAELGFKDAAYFCRFFRRHSAMSPNEFRRGHGAG